MHIIFLQKYVNPHFCIMYSSINNNTRYFNRDAKLVMKNDVLYQKIWYLKCVNIICHCLQHWKSSYICEEITAVHLRVSLSSTEEFLLITEPLGILRMFLHSFICDNDWNGIVIMEFAEMYSMLLISIIWIKLLLTQRTCHNVYGFEKYNV